MYRQKPEKDKQNIESVSLIGELCADAHVYVWNV